MGDMNQQMLDKYRNNFLREVEEKVDDGDWVKMCMQCGVCAGSCPFGPHWEHTPQKIFMMIRAGKREEVLTSDSMWMCTSCYNCMVRCPRKLPITHIMHGLAKLRAPPRPRAEEPADARLLADLLGQLHQDRPRQRTQADHQRVLQGRLRLRHQEDVDAAQHRAAALFKAKRLNPMELFVATAARTRTACGAR